MVMQIKLVVVFVLVLDWEFDDVTCAHSISSLGYLWQKLRAYTRRDKSPTLQFLSWLQGIIMKTPACLLLISLCLAKCLAKSSADLKLQHSFFSPLDEDQKVKLYWNISMANREIFFTVEAQTTGWVGFGISSGQGKMAGADIVIGWVKDGKPYFKVKQTRSKFRII